MRSWSLVLLACCTVALSCWFGAHSAASGSAPATWLSPWVSPLESVAATGVTPAAHDTVAAATGEMHLLVSAVPAEAALVDDSGAVRHRWAVRGRAWEGATPRLIGACPLDDGGLIVIVNPHGAVARLDRDGNFVWARPVIQGRAVALGPDKSIYVVARHPVPHTRALTAINEAPISHEDVLFRFSLDGALLQQVPILDCLLRSDHAALVHTIHWNNDAVATSSIRVLDPPDPTRLAFYGSGTVLLALEHLHAVALIDPERACATWAATGPWKHPTDAQLLPDGTLLVFDSRGRMIDPTIQPDGIRSGRGTARVIEYDVVEGRIGWRIAIDARPGESRRGLATRLANGNTLIVRPVQAVATEITPTGDVVQSWRYPTTAARPSLVACTRLAPGAVAWLTQPAKGARR